MHSISRSGCVQRRSSPIIFNDFAGCLQRLLQWGRIQRVVGQQCRVQPHTRHLSGGGCDAGGREILTTGGDPHGLLDMVLDTTDMSSVFPTGIGRPASVALPFGVFNLGISNFVDDS